jgi:hypothetical protein
MTTTLRSAARITSAPHRRAHRLLGSATLAMLASTLLLPTGARAAAEYCHTDSNGDYVCIEKVFGPRYNRGLIYTVNGNVYSKRYDCYAYNYERSSIAAIACWNYDA